MGERGKKNVGDIAKRMRFVIDFWVFLATLTGFIPSHTVRLFLYRNLFRMKIGKDSSIHWLARFNQPSGIEIGHNTIIGNDAFLDGRYFRKWEKTHLPGEEDLRTPGRWKNLLYIFGSSLIPNEDLSKLGITCPSQAKCGYIPCSMILIARILVNRKAKSSSMTMSSSERALRFFREFI